MTAAHIWWWRRHSNRRVTATHPQLHVTRLCTGCERNRPQQEFYFDRRRGYSFKLCNGCRSRRSELRYIARGDWIRQASMERYWKDPIRKQESDMIRKYGFGLSGYESMLVKQNYVCAICADPPGGKKLHIDHNHATGKVRGLLCLKCNTMLGYARDRCDVLASGINYLAERR